MKKCNKILSLILALGIGGVYSTPVNAWELWIEDSTPIDGSCTYLLFRKNHQEDTLGTLGTQLKEKYGLTESEEDQLARQLHEFVFGETEISDNEYLDVGTLIMIIASRQENVINIAFNGYSSYPNLFVAEISMPSTMVDHVQPGAVIKEHEHSEEEPASTLRPVAGATASLAGGNLQASADPAREREPVQGAAGLPLRTDHPSPLGDPEGGVQCPQEPPLPPATAPVPVPATHAGQKSPATAQSTMLAPEAKVSPATSEKPASKAPMSARAKAAAKMAAKAAQRPAPRRPMPDVLVAKMSDTTWTPGVRENAVLQIYPQFDQPPLSMCRPLFLDGVLAQPYRVTCLDPMRLLRVIAARGNILGNFGCIVIGGTDAARVGLGLLDGRPALALSQFNADGGAVIFLHEALTDAGPWENFARKLKVRRKLGDDEVPRYHAVRLDLPEGHPLLTTPRKLNPVISVKRTHTGVKVAETERRLVVGHGMGCAAEADRYLVISADKSVAMIEAGHNMEGEATPEEAALLTNLVHYCIHASAPAE